jgi:tetratricopeptide (TPR) repeat protein
VKRVLFVAALSAALVLLVRPEFSRYGAERRVGFATTAFRALLDRAVDAETARNVAAVGEVAMRTAADLPGDPRPWMIAGSSSLVTGRPERALEYYREGFATGERAEIDLNLGRAYEMLKRTDAANAAYVRSGWISPEILTTLPADVREPALREIGRLSGELASGRLDAPPPLPPEERR